MFFYDFKIWNDIISRVLWKKSVNSFFIEYLKIEYKQISEFESIYPIYNKLIINIYTWIYNKYIL